MSSNLQTAKLIPRQFRQQLLNDNIIYKAVVAPDDTHMAILVIIYQNFIFNEGEKINMSNPCLSCLSNILDIFKTIQPQLVTLERENQLLDDL